MSAARRIAAIALGAATLCTGQHAELGGYHPVSNVIEHSQMVYDVEAVKLALDAGDYTAAKAIYTGGESSCKSPTSKRTFQGFVKMDTWTKKLKATAFGCSFATDPCGPTGANATGFGTGRLGEHGDFWDDFLLAAFDGTGSFQGKSDAFRKVAINKGLLGVLTMYSAYELESAIKKAGASETADTQAPHAWDEGWAFWYGSHHGAAGKYSAWEFTKKRDSDFCDDLSTCGSLMGKEISLKYFMEGQKASREGDVATMVKARNNIYRIFALSSIRAALKYASLTKHTKAAEAKYNEEYHMEAYAYFLAAAGWIEQASPNTGKQVLALLDYKKTESELPADLYCQVKALLVPAYASLGLDCTLVAEWKDLNATLASACAAMSCPSTVTVDQGITYEPTDSNATVGNNVDCGVTMASKTGEVAAEETSGAFSATAGATLALAVLSSVLA